MNTKITEIHLKNTIVFYFCGPCCDTISNSQYK